MKQYTPLLMAAAICAAAMLMTAQKAVAVDLPVREPVGITNTSPAQVELPAIGGGNGQLVAVQVFDAAQANNTCTIKKIVRVSDTVAVTNTVAAITYTGTYGAETNLAFRPYVFPNDRLTATFTTSSTGTVFFVRTLAK